MGMSEAAVPVRMAVAVRRVVIPAVPMIMVVAMPMPVVVAAGGVLRGAAARRARLGVIVGVIMPGSMVVIVIMIVSVAVGRPGLGSVGHRVSPSRDDG